MNSSEAVRFGSVAVAARPPAMTAPMMAVMARITLLARSAVSLIHSLRRAAGTARRSLEEVRVAVRSAAVQAAAGFTMAGLGVVTFPVLWARGVVVFGFTRRRTQRSRRSGRGARPRARVWSR